jgi:hypothetical protein
MRTLQQSSRFGNSWASILLTLSLIILFSSSQKVLGQQKDGDEANSSSNSNAPGGRVNFNILTLLNGEYLEAFGANNSRGILRGHPTIPGLELGTTTADPLMFSTNSGERMRIMPNGFVGIGTNNPATPFELHFPDATAYSVGIASTSRMRLINNNLTNNNAVELNLSTLDTAGVVATGVRLVGIFTNHTAGAASADFAMVLRNSGNWFEVARFAAGGNVGIGTNAPAYKLDVAGPVRSTSGGFIFPDGTVQTTAGGGGGGSQWVTNGTSIYYNGGNVGLGTSTPGVALDLAQNRAIRVGQATLSSGGDYANLANHGWYNGTAWQGDGLAGAVYSVNGAQHTWYTHNTTGVFNPLMQLGADGSLGIGTQTPSSRLHVNGGSIRLAATAGETPFQLYSYANSSSLWLTSGNPTTTEIQLSPAYAVDYDRSLAVQYTPGTTGAVGGILKIGQLYKNNANFTHGETAFLTNGTERLRINSLGNVGIGTASPAFKLDVAGPIRSSSGGIVFPDGTVQTTAGGGTSSQWTTSGANIYYNVSSGNVGIGGTNPTARLQVIGVNPGSSGTAVFTGTQLSSHFNYNGDNSEDTYIRGGKSASRVILNDQNSGPVLALGSGNFGIGTPAPTEKLEVVGNIKVSGNINAKYQDMAEWVESSQALPAGTVVILDSTKANNVIASTHSYDSRVAGVISLRPGLTLGEEAEGRVLVATTGRVKMKVDATNVPIQIGDLLVTSDREGFAMKSLPIEIGGTRIHRPGTLIGKALEPLQSGTGEILVLLSLQ